MADNERAFPLWWWMIPILLLTTYLGASYLTVDVLWMDEWFTFYQTGGGPIENKSIPEIIIVVYQFLSWPPGFFLSFAVWDNLLGAVIFSDRVFSLCLGLIAVSLMYRLGKCIQSNWFGLLSALIFSTSAFFVYYLHEMRPYTMYMVVVILNAWLYWMLVKNPKAGRTLRWGFVFSITLTLYTHYIAAICVFSIGVYHIVFARQELAKDHWLRILKLGFNGCLLFAPWVAAMLVTVYNESLFPRSDPLPIMLYNILNSFTNGLIWLNIGFFLTLRWWKKGIIRFIWLWIIIVLAVTILVNAYADFLYHPRYVMGILPMVVLLFAYTLLIIAQWKREVTALLLGLWVGMGFIYSVSPLPFMERIPAHLTGISRTTNDTIVDIGESCIADNDFALYGHHACRHTT
ncbi:MAG: glycosyltransferase family 39 protein [Anaerolineae bacterium]|nr:glycosyltransferase family 39 protein [Anaerolineae bacterium]